MASDAFFPFPDGPETAIAAGATALIQPGGSKRDDEVVAACDAAGRDGVHRPAPLPPLTAAGLAPGVATLHVVRVFCAADGCGGNPLGVFLDGAEVPEAERQDVARDLGFAETVFVDDAARGVLRIFTPEIELPLAGHPLVGVRVVAARAGIRRSGCCGRRQARSRSSSRAS